MCVYNLLSSLQAFVSLLFESNFSQQHGLGDGSVSLLCPDRNVSSTVEWIAIKLCTNNHVAFHLVSSSGQNLIWSKTKGLSCALCLVLIARSAQWWWTKVGDHRSQCSAWRCSCFWWLVIWTYAFPANERMLSATSMSVLLTGVVLTTVPCRDEFPPTSIWTKAYP